MFRGRLLELMTSNLDINFTTLSRFIQCAGPWGENIWVDFWSTCINILNVVKYMSLKKKTSFVKSPATYGNDNFDIHTYLSIFLTQYISRKTRPPWYLYYFHGFENIPGSDLHTFYFKQLAQYKNIFSIISLPRYWNHFHGFEIWKHAKFCPPHFSFPIPTGCSAVGDTLHLNAHSFPKVVLDFTYIS